MARTHRSSSNAVLPSLRTRLPTDEAAGNAISSGTCNQASVLSSHASQVAYPVPVNGVRARFEVSAGQGKMAAHADGKVHSHAKSKRSILTDLSCGVPPWNRCHSSRYSCHGCMVDLSFRTSRPEGERHGSIHGARKSQNRMVSPKLTAL